MKKIIILIIALLTILMCKVERYNSPISGGTFEPDNGGLLYNGAKVLKSISELPTCNAETKGQLFYLLDLEQFQYCDGSNYQVIDLTGADGQAGNNGLNGQDGLSIIWQGNGLRHPANPEINWAYYNVVANDSFIWTGAEWNLISEGNDNEVQLALGSYHSCILVNGEVICWGAGLTSTTVFPEFGQSIVPELDNPVMISSASYHTCSLDENGVICWGDNGNGEAAVPALTNPTVITAGSSPNSCAIDDSGVTCWGDVSDGQNSPPALSNPIAIAAGNFHVCAIDDTGVVCWGGNTSGQTTVPGLSNPIEVDVGFSHSCALDDTGVHCWGQNGNGQTDVPALDNPVSISAYGNVTCAIDSTGLVCWGNNDYGQTDVPPLSNVNNIDVGSRHVCASYELGIKCWGAGLTDTGSSPEFGQSIVP